MLTRENVEQALSEIMHPEIDYSLVDLGMIKDVDIEESKARVTVNLPFAGIPIRDLLAGLVKDAVTGTGETAAVEINFAVMSEEERKEFMEKAQEKWKL